MGNGLIKEFLIVFFAGILPLFLAYSLNGMDFMINILEGLMAQDFILYYSMIAGALALAYSFVHYRIRFSNEIMACLHKNSAIILLESASGFLSIMRLSAGLLMFSLLFWVVYDRNTTQFVKVGYLFFVGTVLLIECSVLSRWVNLAREGLNNC